MSFAGTIQRNGMKVTWTSMGGTGGTYNPATGTMVDETSSTEQIYVVVDGYMSTAGKVKSDVFERGQLIYAGLLNVYTTVPVRLGDRLTIDGITYTVMFRKSIWRKTAPVLYLLQVQQ